MVFPVNAWTDGLVLVAIVILFTRALVMGSVMIRMERVSATPVPYRLLQMNLPLGFSKVDAANNARTTGFQKASVHVSAIRMRRTTVPYTYFHMVCIQVLDVGAMARVHGTVNKLVVNVLPIRIPTYFAPNAFLRIIPSIIGWKTYPMTRFAL